MGAGFRRLPRSAWAAIAVGAVGYVLTFYVRSELWPWVGVLLMLLAPLLAIAAIARSRRPLTAVVAVVTVIPLAVFVWAVSHWLTT
jgi:hypothetical protein